MKGKFDLLLPLIFGAIIFTGAFLNGCSGKSDSSPYKLTFLVAGQSNASSEPWDDSFEYSHTGKTSIEDWGGKVVGGNTLPINYLPPRIPTIENPMQNSRTWLLLGDMLNRDVLFNNIAIASSGAQQWVDTYFNSQMAPALRSHFHFDAVLWVQGENECVNGNTQAGLYGMLKNLILRSRTMQPDLKWFVALDSCVDPVRSKVVRAAEMQIVNDGLALQGPDLDVIRQIPSECTPNLVEFSGEGLKHHAELWYPILKELK